MSEEDKKDYKIVETNVEVLINQLFNFKESEIFGKLKILERLEALGPEMSIRELSETSAALQKMRSHESNEGILSKIDKITNQSWKHRKSLEFDGLKKPLPKSAARNIRINSRNDFPKLGFALGVLGLILGIAGGFFSVLEVDYEYGCIDSEFIEEKYGEVTESTVEKCLDDYQSARSTAAFLTVVSPILILFGILYTIYEYVKRK